MQRTEYLEGCKPGTLTGRLLYSNARIGLAVPAQLCALLSAGGTMLMRANLLTHRRFRHGVGRSPGRATLV
jgi:hypothetical protein